MTTSASRKNATKAKSRAPDAEPSRRERILHAAERLFAMQGFHGTSMREIAVAAKVGLSIVVYHFGTKLNLYRTLFERRRPIFEQRVAELAAITDYAAPDVLERIITAFVMPIIGQQTTPEGKYYSLLTVREASDPQESSGVIRDYYDPMARQFIAALQRALPDKSPEYLHWAYLFSVGALVMNCFDERMARLSDHRYLPGDNAAKGRFLVRYIAAGIRGGPDVTASA
jgi:AcrR family transcriptional regulator